MKLYHLYVSGILYAELDFDTQPLSIQKLDIASAKLLPWETLSEEDNAFYKSFTKMDLLKLSHQLHSYEQKLAGDGEVIVDMPEGAERYTSSKDSWYLQRDVKFPNNKLVENGELLAVCAVRQEKWLQYWYGTARRTERSLKCGRIPGRMRKYTESVILEAFRFLCGMVFICQRMFMCRLGWTRRCRRY